MMLVTFKLMNKKILFICLLFIVYMNRIQISHAQDSCTSNYENQIKTTGETFFVMNYSVNSSLLDLKKEIGCEFYCPTDRRLKRTEQSYKTGRPLDQHSPATPDAVGGVAVCRGENTITKFSYWAAYEYNVYGIHTIEHSTCVTPVKDSMEIWNMYGSQFLERYNKMDTTKYIQGFGYPGKESGTATFTRNKANGKENIKIEFFKNTIRKEDINLCGDKNLMKFTISSSAVTNELLNQIEQANLSRRQQKNEATPRF